jgi:RNA polymerase sigma factor (sigma-70 family)
MPSQSSFAALISQHRESTWHWAFHVLQDPDEADDITQDVFVALFVKWSEFRGEATIRTWLYRTTRNAALRRREVLMRFPAQSSLSGKVAEPIDPKNLEQDFDDKVERMRLHQSIAHLSDDEQVALKAHYFEGRSCREIAAEQGETEEAVRKRICRARKSLRPIYEKEILK